MNYTTDQIEIANKTCRGRGAISAKAVVPRLVEQLCLPEQGPLLDFGAGKEALHVLTLREKGFEVVAHEFGNNFVAGLHNEEALSGQYACVYASNVLNVQCNEDMLRITLAAMCSCTEAGGKVIANYPKAPRKAALPNAEFFKIVQEYGTLERIPTTNGSVLFVLTPQKG